MSISTQKFLLILLILGIGVQTFISCTLKFPEKEEIEATSSSSVENSSSSLAILGSISSSSSEQSEPSISSSAENQNEYSSSSDSEGSDSSSSFDVLSSSSNVPSSSSIASSSNSVSSSSIGSTPSSSSLALSSSSACTAKDNTKTQYCSGGTIKEYGSMSDGTQTYKTVVIGTQTWMASNLNSTPSSGKHRCYAQGNGNGGDSWLPPGSPEVKANCDRYGRLYDWETAMKLSGCNTKSCANQIQKQHQGVCPSGWHLPDTTEWNKLKIFIEKEIYDNWEDVDFGWDVGTKLKSTTGWKESSVSDKGVDSYGFGAIGTGYCVSCEKLSDGSGYYSGEKEEAHWWIANEYVNPYTKDATQAYKSKITYNKKVMTQEYEKKADYLYAVRCIKN